MKENTTNKYFEKKDYTNALNSQNFVIDKLKGALDCIDINTTGFGANTDELIEFRPSGSQSVDLYFEGCETNNPLCGHLEIQSCRYEPAINGDMWLPKHKLESLMSSYKRNPECLHSFVQCIKSGSSWRIRAIIINGYYPILQGKKFSNMDFYSDFRSFGKGIKTPIYKINPENIAILNQEQFICNVVEWLNMHRHSVCAVCP